MPRLLICQLLFVKLGLLKLIFYPDSAMWLLLMVYIWSICQHRCVSEEELLLKTAVSFIQERLVRS